jgi:tetratricopeptide (TPR) repeat protein
MRSGPVAEHRRLLNQDDLAAAQPLYERALTIREKVLGPEHRGTATILNNLAKLLERQGDLAAARPLYEPALAIDEKVLGPEHLEVAAVLTNLAHLLNKAGYASKAELLFRCAITISENAPGGDHSLTERYASQYALFLLDTARAAEALPFLHKPRLRHMRRQREQTTPGQKTAPA